MPEFRAKILNELYPYLYMLQFGWNNLLLFRNL